MKLMLSKEDLHKILNNQRRLRQFLKASRILTRCTDNFVDIIEERNNENEEKGKA